MPKELLDKTNIDTSLNQQRSSGMSEHVGRYSSLHSCIGRYTPEAGSN
jgi:hypothetical protein